MRRLLPLLMLLALMACSKASDFKYTGAQLAAMPELQLVPSGLTVYDQYSWDGGQGIALRNMAYASLMSATDQPEADIAAYYERELLARGWQRCTTANRTNFGDYKVTRWCKGILEFQYDTSPERARLRPWTQQFALIYEIRLVESHP